MEIITYNDLPLESHCVMAIGVFDGVHVGHTVLLETAKEQAKKLGTPLVVFTFEETPKNEYSKHISSSSEKLALLEEHGVDKVYFEDFASCRDMTPSGFVTDVLINRFNVLCVVCGHDFMFGKNRSGNTETLKNLLEDSGRTVTVVPPVYVGNDIVSSTLIRKCISEGNMEKASLLLGRNYSFTLPVSEGNHIGRKLGFPTVNQRFPSYRLVPSFGVYACGTEFDGKSYNGVADIGVKPTVSDKNEINCETHIFGGSFVLYGKSVKTTLYKKLRDEKKFTSVGELKNEIEKDVEKAKEFFDKSAKG